jgi:hypothetical protein
MATLKVTGCRVSTTSITISFSEEVDPGAGSTGAANSDNYKISDPASGFGGSPSPSSLSMVDDRTVAIPKPSTAEFNPGDWVTIMVSGIASKDGASTMSGTESISRQIPNDAERVTRDVEDAVTYPILTEQVRFPRSGGGPTSGASSSQGGAPLGQTAALAIGDVLGWKVSSTDPKGFVGALTQAFTLTDVEGHVESSWNPRTYAVQTDLGGGISGAQASLYTRAKDALDQSLSLLDGLYPLDPDADPEYVKALREMARSQMTEIVKEFGTVGLPSILRIDTYFEILLGQHPTRHLAPVQFDPDKIEGTLGQLRNTYGIYFRGNPFNNSIEDEQDITNFRVISDYMTSLLQSWIANREFFIVSPKQAAFFGTQLVLISRQLNVIAETIDEVRFALDSVFIGPNERQTLLLKFTHDDFPPMFLEDVLEEIEKFVEDEGPRLLRDGGKISVTNNILPVVISLKDMVTQARDPENKPDLPDGFKTARVRHSLDDLRDQLGELIKLTNQVKQRVPFPEGALRLNGIRGTISGTEDSGYTVSLSFFGGGIDPCAKLVLHSKALPAADYQVEFFSAERIDVTFAAFAPGSQTPILTNGAHEVTVTNPDGERATLGFTYSGTYSGDVSVTASPINGGNGDNGRNGGSWSAHLPTARQESPKPAPEPQVPKQGPPGPVTESHDIAVLQKQVADISNRIQQLEEAASSPLDKKQ